MHHTLIVTIQRADLSGNPTGPRLTMRLDLRTLLRWAVLVQAATDHLPIRTGATLNALYAWLQTMHTWGAGELDTGLAAGLLPATIDR